jgi:hypothetical protein
VKCSKEILSCCARAARETEKQKQRKVKALMSFGIKKYL